MKKVSLAVIGIVLVAGGLLFLNQFKQTSSTPTPTAEIQQKLPDFELESFSGQKVKLSQLGKPAVIDFWVGWCPFCVAEMPELEKIQQEFKDQLVVLGIHRSETESIDVGAKFAQERSVTYTLLKDSDGSAYKTLTGGRQFMPYALYIDKKGNIIKVKAGPKTAEEMREAVRELLQ